MSDDRRPTFFTGTYADTKVSIFLGSTGTVILEVDGPERSRHMSSHETIEDALTLLEHGMVLPRTAFEAFYADVVRTRGVIRDEDLFS